MAKKKPTLDWDALDDKEKDVAEKKPDIEVDGVFVPDIPMPSEDVDTKEIVNDECSTAFKMAFVGAGQAGARMVESFWKLGYRRVCAINTTGQDLVNIDIPDENKFVMDIGEGGAGKNREKGELAIKQYYEDVYDLMRRSFGKEFDRIIVCAGAGGGTGGGSIEQLIDISHDIAESFKAEGHGLPPAVGVLVAMPMTSEGQKVNANSAHVLDTLFTRCGDHSGKIAGRTISPLIVADNDRIQKLYPGLTVAQFWNVANQSISSLFHLFNSIAIQNSEFTTFDSADFKDILGSGIITFGATPLKSYDSPTDISFAIRDNLKKNILVSNIDLRSASKAGCIFIGHPDVLDIVPQGNLEHGFEMLSRIMKDDSVVHRGIYKGNVLDGKKKPGLVVYTVLGELSKPESRMEDIRRIGGVDPNRRR